MSLDQETSQETSQEPRKMNLDKKASKKHKRVKGKGLSSKIKKGIVIATAFGIITIGVSHYAYKYVPDYKESLSSRVTSVENSMFSNAVNGKEEYALVYNLEDNMCLDETLSNLELESYCEGLNPVDSSVYTTEDINSLVAEYNALETVDKNTPSKDSVRFFEVAAILNDYNNRFNAVVNKDTLDALNSYAETLIKTSVIEALELDASCVANISTNLTSVDEPFVCKYTDPTTGKTFELEMSQFNNFNSLVKHVRKLNEMFYKGKEVKEGETVPYEESEMIKQQENVLNAIKMSLGIKCSISDGVIGEENNIIECVEQKIKCK